jgi:hypothetical protein
MGVSVGRGMIEHMFESLPPEIDGLRGSESAAVFVDAAVSWGRFVAAGEAQRLACIAEWAAHFLAQANEDTSLCAIDEEDDVVAQIGMAFGVSVRWAMNDLQIGAAMRERFPRLAALFLQGRISAKVMATVVERTLLVWDADALANIDAACVEAAVEAGWSGLSYFKLKNAVDVWIDRYDPAAVRRARQTLQGRCFKAGDTNDKTGTTSVYGRLSAPGAALLMGRLQRMAKAVCPDDPRTMEQRIADALEALGADADHLQCLCGSPTCAAAADDGVASRFVIHVYAPASAVEGEPDPLIHGDSSVPGEQPMNVTVTRNKSKAAEPAASGEGTRQGPAPAEQEAAAQEAAPEAAEQESAAQEAAAPEAAAQEAAARESAEPLESPAVDTDAPAAPRPVQVNAPAGVIPGFGVIPNALIAKLLAGGAQVSQVRDPAVDTENHYWSSPALREFVKARDLTCRIPGCDRPADFGDLDHTIPWADGGPTHASNLHGKCRHHHMVKTFRDGWSEDQLPDGTINFTTPTGHTYTSKPTSRLLFPTVNTTSTPVTRGSPRKATADDKTVKMPKRKRSKASDRAYRIAAERALNEAYLALHRAKEDEPPEF